MSTNLFPIAIRRKIDPLLNVDIVGVRHSLPINIPPLMRTFTVASSRDGAGGSISPPVAIPSLVFSGQSPLARTGQ